MITNSLRLFKKINNHKRARYLFAGVVNTMAGYLIFPIIFLMTRNKNIEYVWVLIVSSVICVNLAFLNNKYYVFKSKANISGEYVKFWVFHLINLVINIISLPVLIKYMDNSPIIAQTFYTTFAIVVGYIWHNKYTFKKII